MVSLQLALALYHTLVVGAFSFDLASPDESGILLWREFAVSDCTIDLRAPVPAVSVLESPVVPNLEEVLRESLRRGRFAMARNDFPSARVEFEQVLGQAPTELSALVSLGWIAQREQLWEQSELYLRRALKLSMEDGSIWLALGVATLEQDKLEAATAAFLQTVLLEPKNARARRFLGLTLGKRGWYDGAEQEIRKSLEIEPEDAGAHFNLAVFYLQRRPPSVELARRHYYKARDLGFAADPEIEAKLTKVVGRLPSPGVGINFR